MRRPSAHLTWDELGCRDGTPYPTQWRADRALVLAREFERIRAACGDKPIVVGSAYRTPAYNATLDGAAKNSQHTYGRALDLYPPKGMTLDAFYAIVREIARSEDSLIGGLGKYRTFVHVDIRPIASGRLVVWVGKRAWAEVKDGRRTA